MSTDYLFESLGRQHDRAAFTCGVDALDRYVRQHAMQDIERRVANVRVLLHSAEPSAIIGYHALSSHTLDLTSLPAAEARKLPQYSLLPAALIGRLAVDLRYQRQGHGARVLLDALHECFRATAQVAIWAVLVDAKDDRARQFYEHFDFRRCADHEERLYLPMRVVEELFADERATRGPA